MPPMWENIFRQGYSQDSSEETHWRKPFKCDQCNFASHWSGDLKIHEKIHSGEKQNKCNRCDFASIQASYLKIHLRILVVKLSVGIIVN